MLDLEVRFWRIWDFKMCRLAFESSVLNKHKIDLESNDLDSKRFDHFPSQNLIWWLVDDFEL